MQQKFKIGDKVKVLTKAYSSAYGKEGVITKVGGYSTRTYTVDRNTTDYPPDQYGTFDQDSWRYCFYESELKLVEEKPKTKFKAGDKVVCTKDFLCSLGVGQHYTVKTSRWDDSIKCEFVKLLGQEEYYWDASRFELVTDQEVNNTEPSYEIGQEVYVSNDFNRYLRKGVLLDAIPRNGLMHVNVGGFDCYVEEERVYTKEMKGD